MARNFDLNDFEKVFSRYKGEDREELTERLYIEWENRWNEYFEHVTNSGGDLKRTKKRQKEGRADPHGFETKKFLKWILEKDEHGDPNVKALVLIFITARMRKSLVDREKKFVGGSKKSRMGLWWLIDEWKDQEDLLKHFDSLTAALIYHEYNSMHIAWAIIGHARRMRIGADRKRKGSVINPEEKIRISDRLLDFAEFHLKRAKDEDDVVQFCSFPATPEVFEIYLKGQRMHNKTRLGGQKEAVELAKAQWDDISFEERKKDSNASSFEWGKYLKWWTWYVKIRAASSSMNEEKFVEVTEELTDLEEEMGELMKSYFDQQRERFKLEIDDPKHPIVKKDPSNLVLFQIIRNWRDFDNKGNWKDTGSWGELGFPEMHEKILGPLWSNNNRNESGALIPTSTSQYKHPSAPFQKFVVSPSIPTRNERERVLHNHRRSPEEKQKLRTEIRGRRANGMLKEIEMVRSLSPQFAGNLSCLVMEILYRELLYRLWYEIQKMPPKEDHGVNVEFAIRILGRIKEDIVRLRAFGVEGHPEIDETVKILRGDSKENAGDYAEKLREHLNDSSIFKTTNPGKGNQCYFLGIPYIHHGDDFSERMHSFSHILERTGDQVFA